jgi:hypothetical protein
VTFCVRARAARGARARACAREKESQNQSQNQNQSQSEREKEPEPEPEGGEQAEMSVEFLQKQMELHLEYAAGILSKWHNFLGGRKSD